jgi:ribosome-binding protein aMBF1 (putative translation factor)
MIVGNDEHDLSKEQPCQSIHIFMDGVVVAVQHVREIIRENIRRLRQEAGLSQTDLAKKSKLSLRYISRLETDPPNVGIETVEQVAAALGTDLCTLLCPKRHQDAAVRPGFKKALDLLKKAYADLK